MIPYSRFRITEEKEATGPDVQNPAHDGHPVHGSNRNDTDGSIVPQIHAPEERFYWKNGDNPVDFERVEVSEWGSRLQPQCES